VPATDTERERWKKPNPKNPSETWDPDRLRQILEIVGSQRIKGKDEARLAWEVEWTEAKWQFEKSRLITTDVIGKEAYGMTRQILAWDDKLPTVIEAVSAFPSADRCRDELKPVDAPKPPETMTAASALMVLARPLLAPSGPEGNDFGPLRDAVELARTPEFQKVRARYYDWMRGFVRKQDGTPLGEVWMNAADLQLAKEEFDELIQAEHSLIRQHDKKKRWTVTEYAMTVLSVGMSVGLAFVNPYAAFGVAGPIFGFGGWVAGKRSNPNPSETPLTGASMFTTVERKLHWATTAPHGW
jgi:hypothetical protein